MHNAYTQYKYLSFLIVKFSSGFHTLCMGLCKYHKPNLFQPGVFQSGAPI